MEGKEFRHVLSDYSVPSTTIENIRLDFQSTLQMSKLQALNKMFGRVRPGDNKLNCYYNW
jgi:hypothetical protein